MQPRWRHFTPVITSVLASLALACSQPIEGPDMGDMGDNPADNPNPGGSGDIAAPVLEISAPARGANLGKVDKVDVKGRVTDTGAGVESVTVNGTAVKVESDGSFTTSVKVT